MNVSNNTHSPSNHPNGMDDESKAWSDLLAQEVIEQSKPFLLSYPNYYLDPLRYSPSDTWISNDWWTDTAMKVSKDDLRYIIALEILLRSGNDLFLQDAINLAEENWHPVFGLPDSDYNDLIPYFPSDHPIKKWLLSTTPIEGPDADTQLRTALVRAGHDDTCARFAHKITDYMKNCRSPDLELRPLYWLADLYQYAPAFVDPKQIAFFKNKTLRLLKNDLEQLAIHDRLPIAPRYVRTLDEIAHWSWIFDWHDVIETLKENTEYWRFLSEHLHDDDNLNLLVWSWYTQHPRVLQESIRQMENTVLDGAIAWTRLRGSKDSLNREWA